MSGRRRSSASSSQPSANKRSKKNGNVLSLLFPTSNKVHASLEESHKGKRILLDANQLYPRGSVPRGEDNHLFQYRISGVNEDCETAQLEYEGKCIINGGYEFQSYPDTSGTDNVIKKYYLRTLKADHNLYNIHLGRGNRLANNEKEAQRVEEENQKAKASDSTSDFDKRFNDNKNITAYEMLLDKFECAGNGVDFKEHIIGRGTNTGKTNYKQGWSKSVSMIAELHHDC